MDTKELIWLQCLQSYRKKKAKQKQELENKRYYMQKRRNFKKLQRQYFNSKIRDKRKIG